MLVAPAGYGKSTALGQYLATLRERVVRFNLRADSSTLLGFVRGFADALAEIAPDARTTVTGAYESAQSSPTPGAELATWMHAHVKSHVGLIAIDDLHIAEEEPEVSRFLASLIDLTKGRLRWLLASRSYANLPIGSWMAYEQMELAVDEIELSFTSGEAREVARSSRVSVRDEELARLLQMTEGWPTALSFALRSSTRSLDLSKVEVSTRDLVYRYLAEQVYTSLEETQREFLAVAVVLPEIDVRVLNRAGYDDALARIEDLRLHGAFLVADPDRDGVYRCHDLFREFVKHQTGRLGQSALQSAHRRAAVALEGAGRDGDALYAYADAADSASILRLLDVKGLDLMEEGQGDVVARAMETLDADARTTSSIALAMRGIADSNAGRLAQAETLLHRAAENAQDAGARTQFLLREARVAINRGNLEVRGMLEGIASDFANGLDERLEASAMLVVLLARCEEFEAAALTRERVLAEIGRSSSSRARARVLQRLALSLLASGDGLGARDLYVRVVEDAGELGLHSLASKAASSLASIARIYLHDPTQRLWYAQKALSAASKGGDIVDVQTATLLLLNIEVERGNAEQASLVEKRLVGLRSSDTVRLSLVHNAKAECAAWSGRFDEAYRAWSRSWEQARYIGERIVAGAQCAIYAAASGNADGARDVIERVDVLAAGGLERCDATELDMYFLWCALALAISSRHTLAQRYLKQAINSSAIHMQVLRRCVALCNRTLRNPAVGEGEADEAFAELSTLGYGGHAKLLRAVLDWCVQVDEAPPRETALTPAEALILRSLATGLSPKAIAEETGRSINTVKVHIRSAIQKLGCHGRQEAIAVAQRQGLLG